MAKNDNLTDFLKGLADKFRSVLGTADPLNPQEFEDKIQTVRDEAYSQGFAEGGPTGITATAPDVLSGKVFGSGGSAKATGTMPDQSNSIRTITTDTSDQSNGAFWLRPENDLWIAPGKGYWGSWNWNISRLQIKAANLASAIGLTAAKIVRGNTILGISGAASVSATKYIEVTSSNDKKSFGLQGGGTGSYYYLTFDTGGIIPEMISVQYPGGDFQGVTDNWNYHIIGSAHWFPKSNHDNMQWGTHCVIPIPSASKKYNITIAGHY